MERNKKILLWLDDWRNPLDEEIDWMVFSPIGRDVNVVWVYISNIRKKLTQLEADCEIKASRGVGYSMVSKA